MSLKPSQELQSIEEALKSIHFVMDLLIAKEGRLRQRMDELRITAGKRKEKQRD